MYDGASRFDTAAHQRAVGELRVAVKYRDGLTVLVHPETGKAKDDHLHHAVWMGEVLPLDASVLKT